MSGRYNLLIGVCVLGAGANPDGKATYVIPRPSQGHVIIGGTYQKNNWDTSVNFDTAHSIWERAVHFLPALKSGKSGIISHNVGLRPAREGGPRIELQKIKLPFVSRHMYGVKGKITEEKEFPVIHVYGFGYVCSILCDVHGLLTVVIRFAEEPDIRLRGDRQRKL